MLRGNMEISGRIFAATLLYMQNMKKILQKSQGFP